VCVPPWHVTYLFQYNLMELQIAIVALWVGQILFGQQKAPREVKLRPGLACFANAKLAYDVVWSESF
jgi:hypothetical protein